MAATVQHPTSATTIFLDQPPSCLEFCPEAPDHFVVGTYLLSETKDEDGEIQQTKTGSVQLWRLDPTTNELYARTQSLNHPSSVSIADHFSRSLVERLALPYAVFDLHFHPKDGSKFAIASSTGCVALFEVSHGSKQPIIEQLWTKQVHDDPSIPALFLAWAPQNWFQSKMDGFAVTFSDSPTAVFGTEGDLSKEDGITDLGSFQARQMIEVWFVALAAVPDSESADQTRDTVPFMFTGNDFGSLHTRRFGKYSGDRRDDEEPLSPLLLEHDDRARHHTAGVTAILPLPIPLVEDAPILLTGSYDEGLRVYHATYRGDVLAEQGLGGGVWRLQLLDSMEHTMPDDPTSTGRRFLVLASCMHAGTRVVRVTQKQRDQISEWSIEVLAEFTEHESMNYASDVWKGGRSDTLSESSGLLCVSSSFYDRRVCVWRVSL